MRHQGAATQQLDQIADDVAEARLAFEHLGGQTVDMGWAGIDPRIEKRVEALFDVAVVTESQRRDADDTSVSRMETRGLHVDDGPACAIVGRGATPALTHKFEDGTDG
ncbi:hypothetical protein MGAD_39310 [Mycolicibacterium gadium]|uniref:Uncharacterized protein n=1 Tax=Mycolicibacterium gadium TaxID=1794 RepID=A0A7I7WPI9_MYCGU|nr:hypothetical protein MGAD_39310 [Mycolicibacterium gadium]